MNILQISGSGRNCGKTTLGCALIAAFPALRWIAVKLTPHAHPLDPSPQSSVSSVAAPANKDTSRFCAAGAIEAYLHMPPLEPAFLAESARRADVLLVESGQFIAPGSWPLFHLAIAPSSSALWKPGFAERLLRLHALVLTGPFPSRETPQYPPTLPIFHAPHPAADSVLLAPSLRDLVARFLSS